jgi:hypothetical protein
VYRVGQHAGLTADLGHRLALVQAGLPFRQHLRRELAAGLRFGRHENRGGTTGPIPVHRTLHGHFGYPEIAADVALAGTAVDDQLAGKEAKGRQIVLGVGKDGQMAVEVIHLAVVTQTPDRRSDASYRPGTGAIALAAWGGFTANHHALPAKIGPIQFLAACKTTLTGQEV